MQQLIINTVNRGLRFVGVFIAAIIVASSPVGAATQGISVEDLIVVDCLLPGQVRQLGSSTNYITPRRPVKTSAKNCAIRGGEYVSYDRADYKTALKVWMANAEAGDATAQTYVAEIYERGLGTDPNYVEAAKWYAVAAKQGYGPAQLSLGRLYEQGIGVEKDLLKALNLYRQGNGLERVENSFVSAMENAAKSGDPKELDALRKKVKKLEKSNQNLREKLDQTKENADKSTGVLNQLQTEIAVKQQLLDQTREHKDLDVVVEKLNSTITNQQLELDVEKSRYQSEIALLRSDLETQQKQLKQANQKGDSDATVSLLKQQIEKQQRQIEDEAENSKKVLAALQVEIAVQRDQAELLRSQKSSKSAISKLRKQIKSQTKKLNKESRRNNELIEKVNRQQEALRKYEEQLQLAMAEGPSVVLKVPVLTVTRGFNEVTVEPGQQVYLAGGVVAPAGVKSFTVNGEPADLDVNKLFMLKLDIEDIELPVELKVTDTENRSSSETLVIKPTAEASAGDTKTKKPSRKLKWGKYHALVIGNNDYGDGGWSSLNNAVNDAKAVAAVLENKYGFEVTLILNATRADMLQAVETMRNNLTENDNLLIYYAGHGQRDDANNRAYWIPVDATSESSANWIPSYQITDHVNAMTAKHVLLVVDSCYAGLMTRASGVNAMLVGMTPEQKQEKIRDRLNKRTRMLITAGDNTEVLDAGKKGDHSVFAEAFIAALENNRTIVDSEGIYKTVQPYVAKQTFRINKQSVVYAPIPRARHEGGEFYFIPK